MDVQQKLDAIAELVENARSMPMSASCVVNRAELLELIDDARGALPTAIAEADRVLGARDAVVAEGRVEADRIIDAAYAEQGRLVAETEVHRQALIEAERIVHESELTAERMQRETDDYVDARLANFEVVLQKTLATVERGRARLGGRTESDALPEAPEAPEDADAADERPEG